MLTALALALAASGVQAVPQLRLDASARSVLVGQVFSISLTGGAFDHTTAGAAIDNVTGGQKLNFAFSNATLQVLSVTINPRWTFTSANKSGVIDQSLGTITGTAFGTFPATADDNFDIATFSVKALAPGSGTVSLVSGQVIGRVAGRSGQLIATDFVGARVAVSAVPEPQSWALMLAGLWGVTLISRRRPAAP